MVDIDRVHQENNTLPYVFFGEVLEKSFEGSKREVIQGGFREDGRRLWSLFSDRKSRVGIEERSGIQGDTIVPDSGFEDL